MSEVTFHLPDMLTASLLKTNHSEKKWSTPRLAVSCPSMPEVLGSWRAALPGGNSADIAIAKSATNPDIVAVGVCRTPGPARVF